MPKLKNHSGAKKRFKLTAKGKWKYKKPGKRHLLTPMTGNKRRNTRKAVHLNKTDGKTMRRFLPV